MNKPGAIYVAVAVSGSTNILLTKYEATSVCVTKKSTLP